MVRLQQGDPGRLEPGRGALDLGAGTVDPRLLLAQGALVEHRRERRRQRGDDVAGSDGIALAQRHPRQQAGERRRDDVAIAQARLPVFVDRRLEVPGSHRGELDLDRPRRQRPGKKADRPERGDGDGNPGSHLHFNLVS